MPDRQKMEAPEKQLTLFAVRLAMLEKMLSRLGQFAFIWATAILLGRFFSAMSKRDFWFVTVIVIIEGIGIFFRSQELVEWTHQFIVGSRAHPDRQDDNFKDCNSQRRRWLPAETPLLPWQQAVIPSKYVALLFQLRKIAVAIAAGALSVTGLILQDHTYYASDPTGRNNMRYALNIFYGVEIAEFVVFLLELVYLSWNSRKLVKKVLRECGLKDDRRRETIPPSKNDRDRGTILLEHFFSISYSKSIKDGILEGLKVDLVSFAEELLLSDLRDEHIMGAWALQKFAASKKFMEDALWKIGGNQRTMEKIVDMLNWKEKSELPLRTAAAEILAKVVRKKQHALHVVGIPGSLVSIALLLYAQVPQDNDPSRPSPSTVPEDDPWLRRLGLEILNKLVENNDNCERIRRTRGLLTQVVKLSSIRDIEKFPQDENRKVVVKQSLRLMRSMARVTGATGRELLDDMSRIPDTFFNIHQILQLEAPADNTTSQSVQDPYNSVFAISIFKKLIVNKKADQRIPCLWKFIELLFRIFLKTKAMASPDQGQDSQQSESTISQAPNGTPTSQAQPLRSRVSDICCCLRRPPHSQAINRRPPPASEQDHNLSSPRKEAGKALAKMTSRNKDVVKLIQKRYCTNGNNSQEKDYILIMVKVVKDTNDNCWMDAVEILGNLCPSASDKPLMDKLRPLRDKLFRCAGQVSIAINYINYLYLLCHIVLLIF